ncbi:hypothetical protein [Fibrella aquatica]|uniref:hypothetical protein n=1 Tax=Fibrella aquatica TaxID=3242487 RepID=UPI00352240D0
MMRKWVTSLTLLIALTACQRAKDKGREVLDAAIAKAKKKGSETFQSGVEAVARELITTKTTSFQAWFEKRDSLHVQEIDGLMVDVPPSFRNCFLTYKADQRTILKFVEAIPTQLPDISDKIYIETDDTQMNKQLAFFETKFPAVKQQLAFFYKIRQCTGLAYYQCNRYPFSHLMAFDQKTGTVYHFSGQYWD